MGKGGLARYRRRKGEETPARKRLLTFWRPSISHEGTYVSHVDKGESGAVQDESVAVGAGNARVVEHHDLRSSDGRELDQIRELAELSARRAIGQGVI